MSSHPARGTPDLAQVEREIRAVPDPEIPVISIDDLGVIREVEVVPVSSESGESSGVGAGAEPGEGVGLRVTITPTYSGCPAMHAMEQAVLAVGRRHGVPVETVTRLSPPWTTDWMSERGREALRRFGIAPPTGAARHTLGPVPLGLQVRVVACPHCGSEDTEEIARFGSTACKALRRCRSCREPFDEFKPI